MKRIYETAEINVVVFEGSDIIVASATEAPFVPSYNQGDDETEIL